MVTGRKRYIEYCNWIVVGPLQIGLVEDTLANLFFPS